MEETKCALGANATECRGLWNAGYCAADFAVIGQSLKRTGDRLELTVSKVLKGGDLLKLRTGEAGGEYLTMEDKNRCRCEIEGETLREEELIRTGRRFIAAGYVEKGRIYAGEYLNEWDRFYSIRADQLFPATCRVLSTITRRRDP